MSANNINCVVVNGRLTEDPKIHPTSGEKVYAILRVAINRRVGDGKRTIYYDVKVWNGLAKACVKHLGKGSLISAQGHLDQYDNPETKERWNFITAEQVEFCAQPKGKDKGGEDE